MSEAKHRSGFVNIIGRPNVGKSTLMNALVGERMSIITNKPQTTRHRIIGLLSGEDFQVVFSDTPGIIEAPSYKMQEVMNQFAHSSFEDADLMLFVTDVLETYTADDPIVQKLRAVKDIPLFLVINKTDLAKPEKIVELIRQWNEWVPFQETFPVSALHKANTDVLLDHILRNLPEGPAYYPKDQLTDRPERFFVGEIIREHILEQYEQEIPYSCEVEVTAFQEGTTTKGEPIVRIGATVYVARQSQKAIIIGKAGQAIKKLGAGSRRDIEKWLEQKVFLELHVKVKDNWRNDERLLKYFGYR